MTIKETNLFMERIKSHYQEFIIDDFKIKEWHEELKNFDMEDVNKKLEEHLKSEVYGKEIPKLYFLTKYLTPTKEKGLKINYFVECQICGKTLDYDEYDNHYARCSAINYIDKQMQRHYNKTLDKKEMLYQLPAEEFNKRYDILLNGLLDKKLMRNERKLILKILYPELEDISINEMLKSMI